jgi:predicted nucleic acid-binding protein
VRVADASALIKVLAGGPEHDDERQRLRIQRLAAPHVVDVEVTQALRGLVRGGKLSLENAELAITDLSRLALSRYPHGPLLTRCWQLRDNLSAYDAAYVALAERLGVPLLTSDARLANAPGIRCEVELLT